MFFQNIQTITCKNESAIPLFLRLSERQRRNGENPIKGIDTCIIFSPFLFCYSRNGENPIKGIDTCLYILLILYIHYRRNEENPIEGIDTYIY